MAFARSFSSISAMAFNSFSNFAMSPVALNASAAGRIALIAEPAAARSIPAETMATITQANDGSSDNSWAPYAEDLISYSRYSSIA